LIPYPKSACLTAGIVHNRRKGGFQCGCVQFRGDVTAGGGVTDGLGLSGLLLSGCRVGGVVCGRTSSAGGRVWCVRPARHGVRRPGSANLPHLGWWSPRSTAFRTGHVPHHLGRLPPLGCRFSVTPFGRKVSNQLGNDTRLERQRTLNRKLAANWGTPPGWSASVTFPGIVTS